MNVGELAKQLNNMLQGAMYCVKLGMSGSAKYVFEAT